MGWPGSHVIAEGGRQALQPGKLPCQKSSDRSILKTRRLFAYCKVKILLSRPQAALRKNPPDKVFREV